MLINLYSATGKLEHPPRVPAGIGITVINLSFNSLTQYLQCNRIMDTPL